MHGAAFCPVAKKPTLEEVARGHFRASDGVWRWYPPIAVPLKMEWLPPQMNQSAIARAICAIALLVAGCRPAVEPQARPDLRAWIATSGMYSLLSPSPAPLPPAPVPGAKCESCRGTGKVGDGTTAVTCQDCGGTGVVPTKAASLPPPPPAFFGAAPMPVPAVGGASPLPVSADGGPTFRVVCEDGVCRRIRVERPSTTR